MSVYDKGQGLYGPSRERLRAMMELPPSEPERFQKWPTYPKTENVYTRDEDTHKLNLGDLRIPEHGLIREWLLLEKLDGMNMRICLDMITAEVSVRGRSDNANIQSDLVDYCLKLVQRDDPFEGEQFVLGKDTGPPWKRISKTLHGYLDRLTDAKADRFVLFGEGIGPKIQNNPHGLPTREFRLFDVAQQRVGGSWFFWTWSSVVNFADAYGFELPYVYRRKGSISEAEIIARTCQGEGVVGRTDPYLTDQFGSLIKFKLKGKDLP
jgi:hypothetical protein